MKEILVIGSVAIDEVVHLDGPLRAGSHNGGRWEGWRIGGGVANTAMALARGGERPIVISAVGDDPQGQECLRTLREMGVEVRHIHRYADATTRSLVMLDEGGERTIVNLARAQVPLPLDLAEIPADCIYVRSADPELTPFMAQRARTGPLVAHIPPITPGLRPATVLVGSASDLPPDFLATPFEHGLEVAGETLEWVVITDGPQGATAYGPGVTLEQPAPARATVDSTGAGDVFAAGLCHALARGDGMKRALEVAVEWGAASVIYAGTVPPPGFPADAEDAAAEAPLS